MKKVLLFVLACFILVMINNVFAQVSVPKQIVTNPGLYSTYSTTTPTPNEVIMNAWNNNPDFRKDVMKSMSFLLLFLVIGIIDIILKGFAMWRASRKNSKIWFWVLLVINTAGILPLCYLIFSKKAPKNISHGEHKK